MDPSDLAHGSAAYDERIKHVCLFFMHLWQVTDRERKEARPLIELVSSLYLTLHYITDRSMYTYTPARHFPKPTILTAHDDVPPLATHAAPPTSPHAAPTLPLPAPAPPASTPAQRALPPPP